MTLGTRLTLVFVLFLLLLLLASPARAGLIYVGDCTGELWLMDVPSGHAQRLSTMPYVMTDLAMSSNGVLYGVDYQTLYQVDPSSGAATSVLYLGGNVNSLAVGPDGLLYYTGLGGKVYAANPVTRTVHLFGSMGQSAAGDLEFDSAGNLFMADVDGKLRMLPAGGGLVHVIGQMGYVDVYGLFFQDAALFGITQAGQLLSLDRQSGASHLLASTGIMAYGATDYIAPRVPEPASLTLMGLAAALTARRIARRRRCRNHS